MSQHEQSGTGEPFPYADDATPTNPSPMVPQPPTLMQRFQAFEQRVERRFNILHEELVLIRVQVTSDHAPRLAQVEKATIGAKAVATGKYGAVFLLASIAARAAAKQWPEFGEAIEGVLRVLGL